MLVNISMSLRGYIPGTTRLAPQTNYEAEESLVRSLIQLPYVRVYHVASKRLLTPTNIDLILGVGSGSSTGGGSSSGDVGDYDVFWEVLP